MSRMMPQVTRFSQHSPARKALVRLCQRLNFGQIHRVRVQDADPAFDSHPVVLFLKEKLMPRVNQ